MQKNLTRGNVFATMSVFALPMLLGNILQQAYNVVDTWVVGQFVGADALAGVGSSFTLMTFLTSILLGLCMGSGVVFSTCFGRQDEAALQTSVGNSFVLALAVALALTAIPLACVDGIVRWLNTPAEIISLTRDYLYIVFWGIPAVFLYNFFAAYLKAMGNSLVPLVFLGISTVLNIARPWPPSSPNTLLALASRCTYAEKAPWCAARSGACIQRFPACARSQDAPYSPACSNR